VAAPRGGSRRLPGHDAFVAQEFDARMILRVAPWRALQALVAGHLAAMTLNLGDDRFKLRARVVVIDRLPVARQLVGGQHVHSASGGDPLADSWM